MVSIIRSTISNNEKTETNNLPQLAVTAKTYDRKWNTFSTVKNIAIITVIGFNVLLVYKCYDQQQELIDQKNLITSKDDLINKITSNNKQCERSLNIYKKHNQQNIEDVVLCKSTFKHSLEGLKALFKNTVSGLLDTVEYMASPYWFDFWSDKSQFAIIKDEYFKTIDESFNKFMKPLQHM